MGERDCSLRSHQTATTRTQESQPLKGNASQQRSDGRQKSCLRKGLVEKYDALVGPKAFPRMPLALTGRDDDSESRMHGAQLAQAADRLDTINARNARCSWSSRSAGSRGHAVAISL